jgi:hypothetical protein
VTSTLRAVVLSALLVSAPIAARANGSVAGTVKLAGKPPALPAHAVVKDGAPR